MKITRRRWLRGRTWTPVLICIFTCGSALAQSEERKPSSGIEILKLKWEKQARLPRNFDPSVIPTNSVFSTMESRTALPGSTQAPYGDDSRRDAANRSAALGPADYFPNAPGRLPFFYVYSLKIRNVGPKTIQAVAWNYVFVDATTKAVLGNHQFLSYSVAKPTQTVTLQGLKRTRPIAVVQAATTDAKGKGPKFLERAVIECVLYGDKTTWQNPAGPSGVCELLKENQPSVKPRHPSSQH